MKKFLLLVSALLITTPLSAREINSRITDSVQLTVDGAAVQTQRLGSTYSVSGSNIAVDTMGGLTGGSATAPATISAGSYDIKTDGSAFNLSESAFIGDTVATTQSIGNNGRFASPTIYGNSTTSAGGTAGTLAGALSGTSIPTVTAGGPGTTVVGQRTIELTVFN